MLIRMIFAMTVFSLLGVLCPLEQTAWGQGTETQETQEEQGSAESPDQVLATVADRKIMLSQVQRRAEQLKGERVLSDEQLKSLQEIVLSDRVNRAIVSEKFKFDSTVPQDQIRIKIDLLTAKLETVDKSLEDYLAGERLTRDDLEYEIRWKLGWDGLLERHFTEKRTQQIFDLNRKRFDGTRVKVAQILLPVEETPESVAAGLQLAEQVRASLAAGDVTWNAAVTANSIAPSKNDGGLVGWIQYSEPMSKEFSSVAFGLDVGEVAKPFASEFGVHLIKCVAIEPGTAELGDVREHFIAEMSKILLESAANDNRESVSIEYAEGWAPDDQQESR